MIRAAATWLGALLLAHSWYPSLCCGGEHCHPVPCEQVARAHVGLYDGYRWTNPADKEPTFFTATQHQFSPDGGCHVCANGGTIPICIFTPEPVTG